MYEAIENRLKSESSAYESIRDSVMPKVARWKYYLEPAWHWYPHSPVSHKPTSKNHARCGYGYDKSNRVVVMLSAMGSGPALEEYLRYAKDKIEVSEFYKGSLREVQTAFLKNGRIVKVEKAGKDGSCVETIEWKGKLATRTCAWWKGQKSAMEFLYNEETKGLEARFYVRPDGTRRPIDQPMPEGVTIKSLAEKIRKSLVKGVYDLVAKERIKEPIYCVVLTYSGEGNPVVPPTIAIGTERERKEWLKKYGKEAKEMIWNPEEFSHRAREIDDEDYAEACEWYSGAMMDRSSDAPMLRLINEVAAELAKLDWSRIAKTTKDFVVFAVDLEGEDLRKNMKKSVPATLLKKFKAGGLI